MFSGDCEKNPDGISDPKSSLTLAESVVYWQKAQPIWSIPLVRHLATGELRLGSEAHRRGPGVLAGAWGGIRSSDRFLV